MMELKDTASISKKQGQSSLPNSAIGSCFPRYHIQREKPCMSENVITLPYQQVAVGNHSDKDKDEN